MSTYWTAETITLVERTYVKGAFRGKYHAERSEAVSTHHVEYFQMHIYQAEVTLDEVRKSGQGEFPETTGLRDFEGSFAQPVNCYDPTADAWFQLHIYEPKLEDIVLSKIVREGSENLGTITGTLYGYVTRQRTEERKVAHETPDPIPNIPISNTQGWTRTPTHEFIYRDGTRYRRDYYRHAGGSFCWGEWYAVTQPVSFLSVLQFGFVVSHQPVLGRVIHPWISLSLFPFQQDQPFRLRRHTFLRFLRLGPALFPGEFWHWFI
jgi:hypothetical protein